MVQPPAYVFCPRCGERLRASGPGGRPACTSCDFVHWADPKLAAGVVVEYQGRVLLVRRDHEPAYGRWSLPAGYVDAGEVVEEAARREVLEETGVTVRLERLLGVFSSAGDPVVFVAYAGSAVDGEPRAGEETMEVGLFAPAELPELAFPHDPAIVAAWRTGSGAPL